MRYTGRLISSLLDAASTCRKRLLVEVEENKRRTWLWGRTCRCGAPYEDHSFHGDLCPWNPGNAPDQQFVLENRLSVEDALLDAYYISEVRM